MKYQDDPDKIGQFTISISLRIGLISFFAAFVITLLFYNVKNKDDRDSLTFFVTALATSAGITSAVYALRSIKQNAESQIIDRTLTYIQRWNNPEYLPVRKTAQEIHQLLHKQPPGEQAKFLLDYLDKNPAIRQEITNVLNFLEEMSLCIKNKIIKEELLLDFYKGIVKTYYEDFHVYITEKRRERDNPNIYIALTNLYERWKKLN
jgi:hypothetical protein